MKTLFGIILVGLLFVASLGYVANRLQNSEFLVERTRDVNLYGRITTQLHETLPKDFIKQFPLSKDETTDLIKESVTADEFYGFLGVYSKAYLDYWKKESDQLKINYSLKNVKDRAKTSLTAKLQNKYQRLPICTANQARNWTLSGSFPNCRLADGSISDDSINQQISTLAGQAVNDLPQAIEVNGANEQQQANRNLISIANTAIKISWVATLLLVILTIVIFRRKAFFPLAVSLLFVGLIQIGFSLVAWDWIAQNIGDSLSGGGGEAALAPLGLEVAAVTLELLKKTLGNLTIVILGTGGALLVLGIFGAVRGRKEIPLSAK